MYRKFCASLLFIFIFVSCSWAETFTVTSTNAEGAGSLAWAVNSVNASLSTQNNITFAQSVKSITLAGELILTQKGNVNIKGNGVILKAAQNRRLFTISDGSVIFDSITFTNGNVTADDGGAVKITGPDSVVEFENCTFYNNKSDSFGGAVCVTNGITTLTHCTVAGNTAENGGLAVRNGEMNIFASIIVGNSNNDIYKSDTAILTGKENVIGDYENFDEGNVVGYKLNEVLLTDTNGRPLLDDSGVIKLTGSSIALDYIDSGISYGVNYDELGTSRPQLNYPDAGAYEAMPVAVENVVIIASPYMQIGTQEPISLDIYPIDASINVKDFPPSGITWWIQNPNVLTVDDNDNLNAVGIGETYITATAHGWDSNGRAITKTSDSYLITVGSEARRPLRATIYPINDIRISKGKYTIITPEVEIDMNGIIFEDTPYILDAVSSANNIVTAEIVESYKVRLSAGDTLGEATIMLEARPYPEGDASFRDFKVSVVNETTYSRSSSSGGCNSLGFAFIFIPLCAYVIKRERSRK